jgi:nuclear pore complex protein Nup54
MNANMRQLLQDYDKQLEHLKKWVDDTKQEYEEWDQERRLTRAAR